MEAVGGEFDEQLLLLSAQALARDTNWQISLSRTPACILQASAPDPDSTDTEETALKDAQAEDVCPICMDEIHSSVECVNGHAFCHACLERVYRASAPRLSCPICRVDMDTTIRNPLRAPEGGAVLTMRIGNTHVHEHRADSRNEHQWDAYVDVSVAVQDQSQDANDLPLVDEVIFNLHPTFTPRTVRLTPTTRPPLHAGARRFSVTRRGWGMFEIGIRVVLRTGVVPRTHTFRHMLSFDGDGSTASHAHAVIIPREVLEAAREENVRRRRAYTYSRPTRRPLPSSSPPSPPSPPVGPPVPPA